VPGASRPANLSRDRSAPDELVSARPAESRGRFRQIFQAQNVAVLFAVLVLLGTTFYLGKKFDYLRYEILAHFYAPKAPATAKRFPNLSADELVEQSLIDERVHNWQQAADKLIVAKQRNLAYPELLFRAGKLYYENNNFDVADALFERSIAFREAVDEANYFRGMIAQGRGDFAAAQQFFDTASAAGPFNANYFYSAGEALRRQHRPAEAMNRYQQAALRSPAPEDNICRFKTRMAAIEAGDAAKVSADLDKRKAEGPLTVDWVMTQAALALHAGNVADAIELINRARENDDSFLRGHFAACAGDRFFSDAASNSPQLAKALIVAQASPSH
jgi:tetratricopeptide (TPR) repeat protein